MRSSRNGLATVAFVLAAAVTPAAHAQTPCREQVVADWAAGRLGPDYPVACYQAALAHLPDDVRTYSSAEDDIRRALLGAVEARAKQVVAAAPTPLEPSVRRPAVRHAKAKPVRRPETAVRVAPPPVAVTAPNGGGRSRRALVVGVVALWLVVAAAYLALRRRRA